MTENQSNFNDFPSEVKNLIFSFFKNSGYLLKLRKVCKDWKEVIDSSPAAQKINDYLKKYKESDDNTKDQALIGAVMDGDLCKIFVLQKLGANIYLQRTAHLGLGDTLLHTAVRKNHLEVVRYLLEMGVQTDITNAASKTAREIAVNYKFNDIVDIIDARQNLQIVLPKKSLK